MASYDEWIAKMDKKTAKESRITIHPTKETPPGQGIFQTEQSGSGLFGGSDEVKPRVLLGDELRRTPFRGSNIGAVTTFDSADDKSSFSLTEESYSMHTLLLGGIGSGKTNVFRQIVRTLRKYMKDRDIMVIFDSKGDFYDSFYRPGDILIGNGEKYRSKSWRWNIYGEVMGKLFQPGERIVYDREWELNAKEIMKALFKQRRSSTQPFFADAAADLIAIRICSVMRDGDIRQMHTYSLRDFFRHATWEDYDKFVLNSCDGAFRYAKQYYGNGNTPQALAVFAYVNSMISDCLVGVFGDQDASEGPEFAMRDIVRKKGKKVVFVEYDLKLGEVLGPIYQMLYDQALKEALGQTSADRGNVYLICDEFKLLGELSHIDDGLNFGRSLGVKICAGLQSVNQVYDLYGEEKGKVILSGFSNLFCFRNGDAESRRFVSERFGENYTDLAPWMEATTKNHVQRESFTVEPWDIQRLERGEAVVGLWEPAPRPPFVFKFQKY